MKHKDEGKELRTVESPDGYIFKLFDLPVEEGKDLFQSISLQVKNLEKSLGLFDIIIYLFYLFDLIKNKQITISKSN